jgi:hypothetical protein
VAGAVVVLDWPEWQVVRPPVTPAMLGPLDPGCRAVDLRMQLSDADFAGLAEAMRPQPNVMLVVSERYDDSIRDLEFLRHFPWLDRLSVGVVSAESLSRAAAPGRAA